VPTAGAALGVGDAMRLALAHNPDIQSTATLIAQEDAAVRVARETWFPTAGLSLGTNYASVGGVGGSGFGSLQLSNQGSLNVNKTVADFGQTRTRVAAAEAAVAGARATLLEKQEDVVLAVRQQYFTALADTEIVTIDEASVGDQEKHLQQAQAFYRVGAKSRLDVAQAETSLAQSRLTLVQAVTTRNRDYVNLNVTMGLPSNAPYQLSDASPVLATSDTGWHDLAWTQRPDMLSLETQIVGARANLSLAHMGFNPIVTSTGYLSMFSAQGTTTPGFGLGFGVSLPILDAGAARAAVESSQAVLEGLLAQQVSLHNTIYQAVENDLQAVQQARVSVSVAETGVRSAQESYHLANRRYQEGLGSSLDFLDAQVANSQAQSALVSARTQVRLAEAQLDHDSGRIDFIQALTH
jgi:multidrug efflux system outer membrane protein